MKSKIQRNKVNQTLIGPMKKRINIIDLKIMPFKAFKTHGAYKDIPRIPKDSVLKCSLRINKSILIIFLSHSINR